MSEVRDETGRALVPFLMFQSFWTTVEAVKADALAGVVDVPTARARLREALTARGGDVAPDAAFPGSSPARDAQYVMAAVADDVFVQLPWSGSREWMLHPLELELFGSRSAGQVVFDRLDALLEQQHGDTRGLAAVYLTALALGFKGMYGERPGGDRLLASYRERLQAALGTAPLPGMLLPESGRVPLPSSPGQLLPSPGAWRWAVIGVAGAWLIVSTLVWRALGGSL